MAETDPKSKWTNVNEAKQRHASIEDPMTKRLVHRALLPVYRKMLSGESPRGDVDCDLLVEILEEVFRNHEILRKVLSGEGGDWMANEEDEQTFLKDLQQD